jgi:CRP-like cAMP-binding protein
MPARRRSAGARSPKVVQLGFAGVEAPTASYVDALARLSLFADVPHPQLEALAHSFDEEVFAEGQRVIRQDVTGGGFYVVLDGEAKVVIDGQERARLTRGDFFGEISILTDEPPTADVIATTLLRCLIVPDNEMKAFLLKQPSVMYRMLQVEARRLRAANVWNG